LHHLPKGFQKHNTQNLRSYLLQQLRWRPYYQPYAKVPELFEGLRQGGYYDNPYVTGLFQHCHLDCESFRIDIFGVDYDPTRVV
jgi:hypothetical protein